MAMLDTVQVRALVDETDIGLIEPGTPVTIQVASFPTRRFDGVVERIGIEAVAEQNVTMFPVLVRIANQERLLRPGMNAEVQVHVGEALDVLAVPNAALRPMEDALVIARELDIPTGEGEAGELPYPLDSVLSPAGAEPRPPGRRGARGQELAVFVMRDGGPQMLRVRSGLTDFDYTAVEGELQVGDSVLILPTLGLLEELQGREEWARRRAGGGLGGNR
jgi:HlyD family secretion protein